MEPMITIVILHWNREVQLAKTLKSFAQSECKDFNILIVDNNSDKDVRPSVSSFEIRVVKLRDQRYSSYIAAHNYGFNYAIREMKPDIIIMQHSEMYHQGDVISYASRVTDDSYISFACYSLGQGEEPETVKINNRSMTFNGDSAWYNHPVYRPRFTNFCSAITVNNLKKLNGFDERFCLGTWYEDDYFLDQIRWLGLKVELVTDPFVFHQWHENKWNDVVKIYRNRDIYNVLKERKQFRSQHILTPDL
jgi:GT2 family glycosyltransferase